MEHESTLSTHNRKLKWPMKIGIQKAFFLLIAEAFFGDGLAPPPCPQPQPQPHTAHRPLGVAFIF
jgi:hypothetical protein